MWRTLAGVALVAVLAFVVVASRSNGTGEAFVAGELPAEVTWTRFECPSSQGRIGAMLDGMLEESRMSVRIREDDAVSIRYNGYDLRGHLAKDYAKGDRVRYVVTPDSDKEHFSATIWAPAAYATGSPEGLWTFVLQDDDHDWTRTEWLEFDADGTLRCGSGWGDFAEDEGAYKAGTCEGTWSTLPVAGGMRLIVDYARDVTTDDVVEHFDCQLVAYIEER